MSSSISSGKRAEYNLHYFIYGRKWVTWYRSTWKNKPPENTATLKFAYYFGSFYIRWHLHTQRSMKNLVKVGKIVSLKITSTFSACWFSNVHLTLRRSKVLNTQAIPYYTIFLFVCLFFFILFYLYLVGLVNSGMTKKL